MPLDGLDIGRYHLLRVIGSGGMGEVYLAEDTRIKRQVAIKVIRGEAISSVNTHATPNAARLFEREAKAIARLNHSHILPLFDYGEESVNGISLTFMVMPYCPAGSLDGWLRQKGEARETDALSLQRPRTCSTRPPMHSNMLTISSSFTRMSNPLTSSFAQRERRDCPTCC